MRAAELFGRYTTWLQRNVPAAYENLAPPAVDDEILALERGIGLEVPAGLKDVFRLHNGQRETLLVDNVLPATPSLPTLSFLSTRHILRIWVEWDDLRRETDRDDLAALQEGGWALPGAQGRVKPLYTSPGWIPLWADPVRADYIGLDFDPDVQGHRGQIINFGRNEDRHFVCASTFEDLLAVLVTEVESGAWPASQMKYGDRTMPWFGPPQRSFFEALHRHSVARTRGDGQG